MFFYFLFSIIVVSSVLVISVRNPIYSVLALISVVLNIVILLILLEAEFLALVFVAVYLGAVSVLFLFMVMTLNLKMVDFNKRIVNIFPIGLFIGLIFFGFLYYINIKGAGVEGVSSLFFSQKYFDWLAIIDNISNVATFNILFTYFFPFILIVGLILLVAMLGSIMLTKPNYIEFDRKQQNFIDQQISRRYENAVFLIKGSAKSKN